MLPNGLQLFIADVVDEETDRQEILYIVGRTYNSSFKRFIKWANNKWSRYAYYFNEADECTIKDFISEHKNIKAGIY